MHDGRGDVVRRNMKKIQTAAAVVLLIAGGFGLSQAFTLVSVAAITNSDLDKLPDLAAEYSTNASRLGTNPSAAQISQVNSELNSRLQYIQIRQNAEIIRLLGVIAAKK
jgi:hypothetical protein